MRSTALLAGAITEPASAGDGMAASRESLSPLNPAKVLLQLEQCAQELNDVQRSYRSATLTAAADRALTASEAMARGDTVRRLAALAHQAWRVPGHLPR